MIENSDPSAVNSVRILFLLSTTGMLCDGQITSEHNGGRGFSAAE